MSTTIMRIRQTISSSLVLALMAGAFAQTPKQDKPKTDDRLMTDNSELVEQSNVILVKELAIRASRMRDIRLDERIDTLSDLGDVLWKYDPAYARQLFEKALDLFGSGSTSDPSNLPSPVIQESRKTRPGMDQVRLVTVRARVIARLAKHDPIRAKQFVDKMTASGSSSLNVQTTNAQSTGIGNDDAQTERSLNNQGQSQGTVTYLVSLRSKSEATANELFLHALSELASQTDVDGNDLMMLGVYLFTSPSALASDGQLVLPWVVINNLRTINLSADRPGINRDLIQAYLSTAVGILIRPVVDARQRALYYIACYQLLAKANRYAPDLVPVLIGAMRKLTPDIPAAFSDDATYETLSHPDQPLNADDELARIDKLPLSSDRQQKYLGLVYSAYRKEDFPVARKAANKIEDLDVQTMLRRIIKFGETAKLLDQDKVELAETRMNDSSPNVEDAILSLRIARSYVDKRSKTISLEWINKALALSRRTKDPRAPFLILAAVELLSYYDTSAATSVLAEAVQNFNNSDAIDLESIQWAETVKAGNRTIRFRLNAKGLHLGSFTNALRTVAKSEPEATKAMVLSLRNEEILNLAIPALAHGLLS